jgi:RNA-directed DNA polymerase
MLGIATARDRVVQASLKLVLEPIFEADFKPCSYGFRPRRRAQDAIAEIHHLATHSYGWVLEGDIKACFDEIAHSPLLGRVRDRIGDKRILALVKAFLHAGILSEDGVERDTITGTPQGGILSPLLANIALSVLDEHFARAWEVFGDSTARTRWRRKGGATYKIVRYADDFVIMVAGTQAHAEDLRAEVADVLAPMGLRLSEAKTKVCHIDEGFDFLGFHIRRRRKRGTNKQVVYTYPSKKALLRILDKVRVLTAKGSHKTLTALLHRLNRVLRGWCNYFKHGVSAATFSYLGAQVWHRMAQWLRKRHPHSTWADLGRRYHLKGGPTEGEVTLLNPATVAVTRYRYRGANIPSPWSEGQHDQ